MNRVILALATGFYVGKLPLAPGTWGSLVGVLLSWLLSPLPRCSYVVAAIAFAFFAVWVAGQAEQLLGKQDPKEIVIDEIAGYLIATALFPPPTPLLIIIMFLLFRLFDVTKPFPCRRLEKLPGGWGVVLDDVAAGIYASLIACQMLYAYLKVVGAL